MPYPIAKISDNLVFLDSNGHQRPAICATNTYQAGAVVTLLVLEGTQTTLGYTINSAPFDGTVTQLDSWSWPQGAIGQNVAVTNFPDVQQAKIVDAGGQAVNVDGHALRVDGSLVTQPVSFAGGVEVNNFPATQPISGAVTVSNLPATQPVSGTVSVGNFPASQAVTGAFYPATQPVSGAISVSNFPATQPVSGAVSVSNFPATQAVAVTNFPGSQAVSGTVAVSNLPATQPVSGTVSVGNFPATQPVSGTVGVNNFPASQAVTGAFFQATQPVSGTVSVAVPTRVVRTFAAAFTAATSEGMVTLTPSLDGVPGTPGTSFAVTAGKRLRLSALMLTCFNATAAIHACQVNLRINGTGAAVVSSPLAATVAASTAAATANLAASQAQSLADGLELTGAMQLGVSQVGIALAGQTVVLVGYEY